MILLSQLEYIITEDQMQDLYAMIHIRNEQRAVEILQNVCSHPYTSQQSEREKVLDKVIEFLKSKQNLSPLTEIYYYAAIKEIDEELRQGKDGE